MREIKFRAFHKRYEVMYEVTCIDWEAEFVWVKFHDDDREEWLSREEHFADVVLMQYTILKDKNGVDIYEGDVLKMSTSPYTEKYSGDTYVILFENGAFLTKSVKTRIVDCTLWDDYKSIFKSEVIGNIYENKELLEVLK